MPDLFPRVWLHPTTAWGFVRLRTLLTVAYLLPACASGGGGGGGVSAPVDTTAPFVVATSPAELTDDVPLSSVVSVAFSEAMDPSTLTADSFSVNMGGFPVAGAISYVDNVATFTPANIFGGGKTYTVRVKPAASDMAGNGLLAEYIWTFTVPAPHVAYVANKNDASVSIYWVDASTGILHPRGNVGVFGSGQPAKSPIALSEIESSRLLLVANFDSNNVTTFQIDEPFDPVLQPEDVLYPIAAAGGVSEPQSVAVARTPSGDFVYVANSKTNNVRAFKLNHLTNTLEDLGLSATQKIPLSLAVDRTSSYLYAANFDSSSVTTFHINPDTGVLEFRGNTPVGAQPRSVATYSTSGNGQVVYIANRGFPDSPDPTSHEVVMLPVDPVTGVLIGSQKQRVPLDAASRPESVTVDPTGRFLYVADPGLGIVAMLPVDQQTGLLGAVTTTPVGGQPVAVKVDPTGRFAYVVDFGSEVAQPALPGNLRGFSIDQLTGALTPNGGVVATGNQPYGMTIIDP